MFTISEQEETHICIDDFMCEKFVINEEMTFRGCSKSQRTKLDTFKDIVENRLAYGPEFYIPEEVEYIKKIPIKNKIGKQKPYKAERKK